MLLSGLFVVGSIAVSHWHTATHGPHLPLFGNASCLAISLAAYWNIKKSGSLFPSRSRLEAIFEKSPSGFASLHRGRIMWANPGLADLLGLGGAEEVQGRQITDFLKKPTDSNDQDKIRKAFGANQEFLEQVSLAQAQGKEITCLAQAIRIDEKDPEKGVFLGMTDLLRINDLQNRLSHSESRYRALIEQAWELILVIKDEKIVFANSAALEFYGGAPGNNKPVELSQLIHPDHFKSTDEYLGGISEGQTLPDILRVRLINNNNESIWTDMVARAVDWEDGLALQVVFRNVDERIKLERKLEKLASTDPLTGADNRRTLHEKGQNELIRCRRYGSDMVVMMIDVDHFKKINDTMGHFLGDEVLKALVNHCQKTLRASDFFGRLGGEEFVAVLTESNIAQAHQVAQRLRQSLMQLKVAAEPKPVSFTVSIGLATNAPGDAFFEEILNRADKAMYLAKRRGRNQVAWLETEQQMEQAQKNDAK
jgi:diguanylate cyclase (GGDEF)-like protein/PAS domain S-box-containing protein